MYFHGLNERQKALLEDMTINELIDLIEEQDDKIKQLEHETITNKWLWCIDQNPKDVEYSWIVDNAFQI